MKLIGITGGIGAGKTTVSKYLAQKGYTVLDADRIAKELQKPGAPMLEEIGGIFGPEVLNPDKSLNRRKLADLVFSDPDQKEILDKLMHGRILQILQEQISEHSGEEILFVDAPLLFEANWDVHMDRVITVDADLKTRIRRVMERDPLSREEVLNRIQNQMGAEERNRRSDYVLDNSGDEKALYEQIDHLLEILKESTLR